MTKYQNPTIAYGDDGKNECEGSPLVSSFSHERTASASDPKPKRRAFIVAMVVLVGAACLVARGQKTASADTTPHFPVMGSSHVARDCTLSECSAASCDEKIAPFLCLRHNGGPHMGCSPVGWTEATCSEQCNLGKCSSLPVPDDYASCETDCGEEWCEGAQTCGATAPYQCMDGSARYGCSADPLGWTLRTSPSVCNKCCDTTACAEE